MITVHPLPEPRRRVASHAPRTAHAKATPERRHTTSGNPRPDERHPCACRSSDACS